MGNGFMGKILRVNLNKGSISEERIPEDKMRKYLGGVGIATSYLYEEVPAGIDPLGEKNKLIFMTGPLTGTTSASAARYSVVAKSPLTGIWGHGNSGGNFGPMLKRSGYDGIIIEGVSPKPVYLEIVDGKAELKDAAHLWGKSVNETEALLQKGAGQKPIIASIGQGGENLVRYSAIMNNSHRAVGRCGLGAVMGSKKLKAVVCSGKTKIELHDPEEFKKISKKQIGYLNESVLKVGFEAFGTNLVADMVNARGGYPTLNWQKGVFDQIEEMNGQAMTDKVLVKELACFGCPIACGRGTAIKEGKWAGRSGEGPEYETTNMFGACCGIADMNAVTMANYLCNEYGLDTISTGSSIAFAMECFEKGILTKEMTGGIDIKFGDSDIIVELVEKIAKREGIGDLLAEGTKVMAEKLGGGSSAFAMNVKGLELPAYDPRAAKICGLGFVTANRGGDHITGFIEAPTFIDAPILIVEESSIEDPLNAKPEEAKILMDMEDALTSLDALGGCKFMGALLKAEDLVDLIRSATGWNDFSVDDFRKCGERIYNLGRVYCNREGIRRKDDVLPERLMKEPLPEGPAEGMVLDAETLEMLKDAYYKYRGWDLATGIPTPAKLKELGMDELIEDVKKMQ
ncbi:MAG TPA: aldehyde ferredoxin oxidoreductase family protein [Smithellaceae bacterium]|nr:aldehyde ferredoxin oxidoreductase family protein [Smithellaceae bacterium]HRS88216.1 aldehyde ferredoxin oxidoreductase family protein [Smithellaceae bacterium]HRV25676.1 aldehyde ferredoxin oxidoreductase family protein [Smithellaceae bacterium]